MEFGQKVKTELEITKLLQNGKNQKLKRAMICKELK